MEFDAILLRRAATAMIVAGFWRDRTINDDLDRVSSSCPDKMGLIAVVGRAGDTSRLTYREMAAMADRIAVGLHSSASQQRRRLDAIAELVGIHAVYLACSRIGAVLNPLMPIFRERELRSCCSHGEAGS